MALAAISGMAGLPYMQRFDAMQQDWQQEQLRNATSNFRNPYNLMAPPFENVRRFKRSQVTLINPTRICPAACGESAQDLGALQGAHGVRSWHNDTGFPLPGWRSAVRRFACHIGPVYWFADHEEDRRVDQLHAGHPGRRCRRLCVLGSSVGA